MGFNQGLRCSTHALEIPTTIKWHDGKFDKKTTHPMKYLQSVALVTALGLSTLGTGCATITDGTHQDVSVKTRKDSVDVAGANCVLTNSKGTWQVTTPGKVTVHRAKDDLSVKCTMDGAVDAVATVKSSTRKGAVAGNAVMFGLVGMIAAEGVDKSTGGAYVYPDDITVSFDVKAEVPAPSTASTTTSNDTPATLTK
jgi:hypothetical protein